MNLQQYFEENSGYGVLATADGEGVVDVAVYARPHFEEGVEDELAFIMNDRLSHANLQSNPHAAYMFIEDKKGYQGKRLILTRVREDSDSQKIQSMARKYLPADCCANNAAKRYLVYFQIKEVRPLVGAGTEACTSE